MKNLVLAFLLLSLSGAIGFAQEGIIKTLYSKDSIITFRAFDIQKTKIEALQSLVTIKKLVNAQNDDDLILQQVNKGEGDMVHYLYQQYYKGIKVESGMYFAHVKNGILWSVNGDFYKVGNVNTNAKLTESEALVKALDAVGAKIYEWQIEENEKFIKQLQNDSNATYYPKGEIFIIYGYSSKSYRLAYKFNICAHSPFSSDEVYIDAITGELLGKHSLLIESNATGPADTRYSGTKTITTDYNSNVYRLRELTNSVRIETYNMRNQDSSFLNAPDFTDNNNNWTAAEYHANLDDAALDAHWGLEKAYAYWNSVRTRNSWDNNRAPLLNYVHADISFITGGLFNNDNAFWDPARKIMIYGDGLKWFNPLVSLDIIAHETGHAYANGTYHAPGSHSQDINFLEALALNEGLSDIWGACIEHWAAPTKQTWLIGEEVLKNASFICMRSMRSPITEGFGSYDTTSVGHYPDTYQGPYWSYEQYRFYTFSHINCTVIDHWFYLLSVGGQGVSGIGIDEAAGIVWDSELYRFTSNTSFAIARELTIQSAIETYGTNSCETMAVTNAWHAVGIGESYSVPNMTISGPPLVCTNGTYTLNNALKLNNSYSHITWSVNPSYLVSPSSGGGGLNATTSKVGNGNPTITFNPGCGINNVSKQFHTGPYSSSDYPITGPSSAPCKSYVYYSIPTLSGVTSINWTWPSGWAYVSGQNTISLALRTGTSGGMVSVGVNNTCGQSGSNATKYTSVYGSCGYSLSIYPNPASSELNIFFESIDSTDLTANNGQKFEFEYEIKIYNLYQELIYSVKTSNKTYKISISEFPDGSYILVIMDEKEIIQEKKFIKYSQ